MGRNKFQKPFLTRVLDSVPGKQTFGIYRYTILKHVYYTYIYYFILSNDAAKKLTLNTFAHFKKLI